MFTPTIDNYAFGWEVRKTQIGNTTDSVLCIQHGGSINGFTALICRIPQDKNLIVILSNSNAVPIGDISRNIKAIIYEKLYDRPKMSVADAVLSEIGTKGAESVRTVFKNLMDREFATYELNEVEMNQAGYSLLAAHKIAEAIEVFKLNVEAFPSSSNVYNSLGEAYMMHGDTELAIENYKKSLELDHNNTNAIQKLKELETK
jgi:tetratricopeptide (TPR) repeat protein